MEARERQIEVTCPECRGPIRQMLYEDLVEYRCLVGHSYSPRTILAAHLEAEEKALWAAVVALEEAANLARTTASQLPPETAAKVIEQAEPKRARASEVRRIAESLEAFQVE